jgi:hypothetical protein
MLSHKLRQHSEISQMFKYPVSFFLSKHMPESGLNLGNKFLDYRVCNAHTDCDI